MVPGTVWAEKKGFFHIITGFFSFESRWKKQVTVD